MEHQLEHWLEQAEKAVEHLLSTVEKKHGHCENCGATSVDTYFIGTAFECGVCFVETAEYWEKRGGHSSEIIFDGDPFPVDEFDYDSPVHRAIVAHYFAVMAERIVVTHLRAV